MPPLPGEHLRSCDTLRPVLRIKYSMRPFLCNGELNCKYDTLAIECLMRAPKSFNTSHIMLSKNILVIKIAPSNCPCGFTSVRIASGMCTRGNVLAKNRHTRDKYRLLVASMYPM
eukprot:scaffold195851_cov18-Prasinocladus_malaysianus.AAC.1